MSDSKQTHVRRPLTPERKAEAQAADYTTGFAVPPTASQFQKGTSGNPKGRPKGARSLKTDLVESLDFEIQLQLPTGPEMVTIQRAIVLSSAVKAAKGDSRAALVILKLMEVLLPERLREAAEAVKLDPADSALLAKMLGDMGLGGELGAAASVDATHDFGAEARSAAAEDWEFI